MFFFRKVYSMVGWLICLTHIVIAQPNRKMSEQNLPKMLSWSFPIHRTHAGVLMGNGVQGLMIWGEGRQLNITIGRAGFWDHRGGNEFSARTTFAEVKKALQDKDEAGIKKIFELPKTGDQGLGRPQQIGGGRLELTLPEGWTLQRGKLNLEKALLSIVVTDAAGKEHSIQVNQSVNDEVAWVQWPVTLAGKVGVALVPSWKFTGEQLSKAGVTEPKMWTQTGEAGIKVTGFTQELPADDPLSIGYVHNSNGLIVASALGKEGAKSVGRISTYETAAARKEADAWWKAYWTDVPRIQLPDSYLQEIVDYGLYKQACATPPQGIACALQGPFMEEYQLPPWSNDYHFNINIEMIYWPALATNRLSHFDPLWNLIKGWMPQLKYNGEKFFGREGALMLPHAVDDRCHVVGTFWTGTIDHACTAWMAQMAWSHYRYGMDKKVLEEVAWPLLQGAFEGYWAMLEEVDDGKGGKRFSLPVSVSPEYRGSSINAWGRDASFQLAALHRVIRILPEAAGILNKNIDSRWAEVGRKLPPYTLVEGPGSLEYPDRKDRRIALWEGMDLTGSHRHHSHLGSIYPFATVNPKDPSHAEIVKNSLNWWLHTGTGSWTGWCVPWASIIWARNGQTEAAVNWLHYWKDNFTNEGRGTLHNAANGGTSTFGAPIWSKLPPESQNREVMQLDAGFGALNAVLELLVQNREDAIYVLPELHRDWKELTFENVGTEGAFQVSAKVSGGKTREIRVKSLVGGPLRLAHGLGESFQLNNKPASGKLLVRECKAGEEIILKRL